MCKDFICYYSKVVRKVYKGCFHILIMKKEINITNKISYKPKRIQQREITVTEFSDGTFDFDAIMWKLTIPKRRATEFFNNWRKGMLEENFHFDKRKPKLLEGKG